MEGKKLRVAEKRRGRERNQSQSLKTKLRKVFSGTTQTLSKGNATGLYEGNWRKVNKGKWPMGARVHGKMLHNKTKCRSLSFVNAANQMHVSVLTLISGFGLVVPHLVLDATKAERSLNS